MNSRNYKEIINQLANEWTKMELPGANFVYADYIRVVGQLLTTTQSKERAEFILMGILNQASELGKTSDWVEQEIRFEELAEVTNRSELVRLQLKYSAPIDDNALDIYNERLRRFDSSVK